MLISIVTVTKNDCSALQRTFESLKRQSARNYEWIVVDGASTDGSIAFLQSISENINLNWVSELDKGIYSAMNRGIGMATAPFVWFLNAGDTFANSETLSLVESALRSVHEQQGVFYGGYLRILGVSGSMHRRAQPPGYLYHSLPTSHQAMIFPTNATRALGFDTTYKVCGDYDITARLHRSGIPLIRLDQELCRFAPGGFSFRHPALLVVEAARVQRTILNMSLHRIFLSAARRCANILGVAILHALKSSE